MRGWLRLDLAEANKWPGKFSGIAALDGEDSALAWRQNGEILLMDGTTAADARSGTPLVAAAWGESGRTFGAVSVAGDVLVYSRDQNIWASSGVRVDPASSVSLQYLESLKAAVVSRTEPEAKLLGTAVAVIDLSNKMISREWRNDERRVAVDGAGGKIAWLSARDVEEFELVRERNGAPLAVRPVTPAPKWPVEPVEDDVGEPQDVVYGPYGEYLLTVNAPILETVGPMPGDLRLWYANGLDDPRAGDPHRGTTLASRSRVPLQATFDREGGRIAAFFNDGYIRVWEVTPESTITIGSKAADVFAGRRHLGAGARDVLELPATNTRAILAAARRNYRSRLPENVGKQIAAKNLAAQAIVDDLDVVRPATAALQLGGRTEVHRWPREAFNSERVMDDLVRELRTVLTSDRGVDVAALRSRYFAIIRRAPRLLAGAGLDEAKSSLRDLEGAKRARACARLAFAGDGSAVSQVAKAAKSIDPDARAICGWASSFLARDGRNLGLDGPLAAGPGRTPAPLVYLPRSWLRQAAIEGVLPCQGMPVDERVRSPAVPAGMTATGSQADWRVMRCARFSNADAQAVCDEATRRSKSYAALATCAAISAQDGYGGRLNMGVLLRDQRRYDEALLWTEPLLGNTSSGKWAGSAENFYGYVLHLMGRDGQALPHLRRAISQGRPDGWAERNLAQSLGLLGRHDEAILAAESGLAKAEELLASAKKRDPKLDPIKQGLGEELGGFYNALAWQLVTRPHASVADATKAIELATKACEYTENKNWDFLDTLAVATELAGDACQAARHEREALSLAEDADDRKKLGENVQKWDAACAQATGVRSAGSP